MEVVPVIDLMGGQVVHAREGRRGEYRPIETPLARSSGPLDVVSGLLAMHPFRRLYVADLDAIGGQGDHRETLRAVAARFPGVELWVDGGVGTSDAARIWLNEPWLEPGQGSLVLGSESQIETELLTSLRQDPRVVLSLDFRADEFQGPPNIWQMPALWPKRVIVMTLARVGAGHGPDLDRLTVTKRDQAAGQVYAAGGVRDLTDLNKLARIGAAGALVATSLHTRTLTTRDLESIARP